jgi:hypothetical protein
MIGMSLGVLTFGISGPRWRWMRDNRLQRSAFRCRERLSWLHRRLHEILPRHGLLEGIWCLDPEEGPSPGQAEALTRVQKDYPHLMDDGFVAKNRERWLS